MNQIRSLLPLLVASIAVTPALAGESMHDGDALPLFWGLGGEADIADTGMTTGDTGTLATWDAYAWIGDDDLKLRVEFEGDRLDHQGGASETRAFLSWSIAEFWDLETGVMLDDESGNNTWGLVALHGMLPYFLDTTASAFVSNEGDVTLRIKHTMDFAMTQDVFIEPHVELNASLSDISSYDVGAGLTDIEAGLQLRYEITRKFAPYIDIVYERDLGETSSIHQAMGESVERTTLRAGLKFRF